MSKFWHFGLKFFFSKNYGLTNYKEQVDIFDSNKFKINLNLIIINVKNSSVYLTKLLNIFFIKTTWKNKKIIKKHIFKFKTLKLKFLTGYYNYLSKDWRGTSNYFYQRFLTGRIYKTYLKSSKLRFNKFILHFIKYFFLKKFLYYRGWWSSFTLNLINNSSLSYISLFFCSSNFKNLIFNPKKKFINNFNLNIEKKLFKINNKWNIFKYKSYINLNELLKHKLINKLKKFYIYYKHYYYCNEFKKKKNYNIYIYYIFFFNFFLWNNLINKQKKIKRYLQIRWKNILNLNINSQYLINKTINKYNNFNIYYKSKIKNISFFKYFKIFKKTNIFNFLSNNLGLTFDKMSFLKQNLKKNLFNNIKTYKYNKKIIKWDKQKKFLYIKNNYWFINIKDKILWQLYKPYIININQKKLIYNKIIWYNKYYNYLIKLNNILLKNKNKIFINNKKVFIYKNK